MGAQTARATQSPEVLVSGQVDSIFPDRVILRNGPARLMIERRRLQNADDVRPGQWVYVALKRSELQRWVPRRGAVPRISGLRK